jgi:hypothetical protein
MHLMRAMRLIGPISSNVVDEVFNLIFASLSNSKLELLITRMCKI